MTGILMQEGEYFLRMLLGAVCGAAIGYERKSRMKEAGVRTHLIVALASVLMMVVSKYGFFDVVSVDGISLDASRIAANIIVGVNFLGAGVIFANGRSVTGLTTAAGIWATSGVGLAIGAGMYGVGISATVFILFIQVLLHRHFRFLEGPALEQLAVTIDGDPDAMACLQQQLAREGIEILNAKSQRNSDGTVALELSVKMKGNRSAAETLMLLQSNPHALTVEI